MATESKVKQHVRTTAILFAFAGRKWSPYKWGHRQIRDFNVFFASVFNTYEGIFDHKCLKLEDCDSSNDQLLSNSELVQDLLLYLSAY